jgi:hypothetical protein
LSVPELRGQVLLELFLAPFFQNVGQHRPPSTVLQIGERVDQCLELIGRESHAVVYAQRGRIRKGAHYLSLI